MCSLLPDNGWETRTRFYAGKERMNMTAFEKAWRGFNGRVWREDVNVRDFIQQNYTPYDGDESFLAPPTEATDRLWGRLQELQKEERARGGVLECETEVVSGLTAYGPGYIDESMKELEKVVGLQTDLRLHCQSRTGQNLHRLPQDPQSGGV